MTPTSPMTCKTKVARRPGESSTPHTTTGNNKHTPYNNAPPLTHTLPAHTRAHAPGKRSTNLTTMVLEGLFTSLTSLKSQISKQVSRHQMMFQALSNSRSFFQQFGRVRRVSWRASLTCLRTLRRRVWTSLTNLAYLTTTPSVES